MAWRARVAAAALLWIVAVAVALMVVGCNPSGPVGALHGQPLPELDMPLLDGGRFVHEDLSGDGRPVVINFWATWCGPCIREIPTLRDLHESGEVKVVSISLDDAGPEMVKSFVEDQRIEYPVLLDGMAYFRRLGGVAIPYTLILDSDLTIRSVFKGLVSKNTLDHAVADAMVPEG